MTTIQYIQEDILLRIYQVFFLYLQFFRERMCVTQPFLFKYKNIINDRNTSLTQISVMDCFSLNTRLKVVGTEYNIYFIDQTNLIS